MMETESLGAFLIPTNTTTSTKSVYHSLLRPFSPILYVLGVIRCTQIGSPFWIRTRNSTLTVSHDANFTKGDSNFQRSLNYIRLSEGADTACVTFVRRCTPVGYQVSRDLFSCFYWSSTSFRRTREEVVRRVGSYAVSLAMPTNEVYVAFVGQH